MNDQAHQKAMILSRLDRIPIWPYSPMILLSVGAGFFFAFFDIVSIGLALPKIEQQFAVSSEMAAWSITSSLVGYILGSFIDSRLADRYGRRIAIYISIFFFSIGSLFCAFSQSITSLIFYRLIAGMGLGAEIAIVSTLMSELSPANYRGQYTSKAVAFGMLGFAVVPFIGLFLVPDYSWGWRALFVAGSVGGIVIAFTRWWVPESPRWLIARGRIEEAEAIVAKAEARARKYLKTDLPTPLVSDIVHPERLSVMKLFQSPYHRRLVFFIVIWFMYYLGNYAWLTLSTTLFVEEGFQLTRSIGFVAISSCGFIVGSLIPITLGDHIERKKFAATVALIWSLVLLLIGWFPTPWVIRICGFTASTTIAAIIPIMYAYTAENFPTGIRATCISVTDGLGHLGGAFCGQVILGIYTLFAPAGFGFPAAFTGMALTGFITAVLLMFGINMTRIPLRI
ncbi:MFS transporter [Legionella spiritensis]|uniref:Major facilitator superfamily transporter n=1 Tax=Legionella spiritensis TaxID=452 RepID=A0A0W0YW07_LEGSP|nr:MFS transporter [Legionella spiritensis]KTD61093.1 major facilitator superfamily transporter [Legionella spiritensis]SNV44842.1 major facilitator superfamily transporter [Legionella spiritensis]